MAIEIKDVRIESQMIKEEKEDIMKGVMQKVQRFGGAMFTPVLLFSFAGIMVGSSTLFLNASIFGTMATEGHFWYQIWFMVQEGALMVFRQMHLNCRHNPHE